MQRFEHGGDVYTHPGALDFSASLNPLGMPTIAVQALIAHVPSFEAYPDPKCHELVRAMAAFEGVPEGWVLPCAGATDALVRLCQALRPRRALVCAPCYGGYEQALEQVGATVAHFDLRADDDFSVGRSVISSLSYGIQLVFLANPNNPTGRCLERDVLIGCLERVREIGAIVALDECFIDLTGRQGSNDLLDAYHNLVIIKALTKTFCLAGLRVGYALCADEGLLECLRKAGQPWAVSVPAQVAGVASLGERDYLRRSVCLIAHERARLATALSGRGLRVVPSQANYLLFEGPRLLDVALAERGLIIRPCDNFRGLDATWYRIAVRTPKQNDMLLAALEEVLPCLQDR